MWHNKEKTSFRLQFDIAGDRSKLESVGAAQVEIRNNGAIVSEVSVGGDSQRLNPGETKIFQIYSGAEITLPSNIDFNIEENFYGKGTWKAEGNLVFFYTDKKTEMDEKYKINFTNSKARYITKSPRDKSDKIVKTALRFYESDLFYIKGLELFKE